MEIGGYIELDKYNLPMLHEGAIALNSGRNCLTYLIRARKIRKIFIPYFLCDSVKNVCKRENVEIKYYHINEHFFPSNVTLNNDEWFYIVNYYGQITSSDIEKLRRENNHIIIDNAQAYFASPKHNVDTIYTCRKFFGVPDGAFLYTDAELDVKLPIDESYKRMNFLLGRFERTASEFYGEYVENNYSFENEPPKRMSKLTTNLLHAIDYKVVKEKRRENFAYLQESFDGINQLSLRTGDFMYPLMIDNGTVLRKKLQEKKIYIPMLWPSVLQSISINDIEYKMVMNILPLPVDQRYGVNDMKYMVSTIKELLAVY